MDGCYSAKAGYKWLCSSNSEPSLGGPWNWIWNLSVPEKIKLLLWLIGHNSLPTFS